MKGPKERRVESLTLCDRYPREDAEEGEKKGPGCRCSARSHPRWPEPGLPEGPEADGTATAEGRKHGRHLS